jgi:tripartite-type tricarboxylate transporter receptor subunit TctC
MSRGLQGALTTACGLLMLLGAFAASAQDYPARTVRIVVPYAPGGVSDIAARVIGGKLAELWKQPVVVENRTGGGGVVGTSAVAKASPDGYTLLIATVAEFSLLQHLYANLSFNAQRDFAPILILTDTPQMWAAAANAPFSSVQEMIAYAKSRPEGLAFASPGNGTLNHLVGERFALETGIKLVHVPYKGGAPAATALASGEVPVGMVAATAVAPHIKSGRVKAIAVTTERRIPLGPEWPTVAESGLPGFIASTWVAMVAPAGTPPAVIAKVNADVNAVLKLDDVRDRLSSIGTYPVGSTPEELAAKMRDESARYGRVIEKIKLKVD